jgi:hypothetical protein
MSFQSDQTTQDQNAGTAESQTNEPFLVVGDRVYQTKEDLLKKIENADQHIETLEKENRSFQESQAQAAKEEEKGLLKQVLEAVKQNGTKAENTTQSSKPELNEDEIVDRAVAKLKAELSEAEQEENMNSCMVTAEEVYGEQYLAKVQAKAKEIGMDMDKVDNLAKTAPQAFAQLFLPTTSNQSSSFAGGSTNSSVNVNLDNGNDKGNESKSIARLNTKAAGKRIIELANEYNLYSDPN